MPVPLSEDHVQTLLPLLKQCTALIRTTDGKSNGAGFFVDETTLLTCAHVVQEGEQVEVTPYGRAMRLGKVGPIRAVGEGDVALVEVEAADGDSAPQPAVLLDEEVTEGSYHAAGFPSDDQFERGLEALHYEGGPRNEPGSTELLGVQLRQEQVTFGMSGGPVLNDRTGAVVGVTVSSKGTETSLGGGAIPIAVVARHFGDVRGFIDSPPPATDQWREALPAAAWEEVGRLWPLHLATFDIRLCGQLSKWQVTLERSRSTVAQVAVRDMSEDIAQVLYRWAQTRPLRAKEEVQLLGGILFAALFPGSVADRLKSALGKDELYVRVAVDPDDNELADLPWEIATVPTTEEGLGAAEKIRFVRVSTRFANGTKASARTETPSVMGVVFHPENDGSVPDWLASPAIGEALKEAILRAGFHAQMSCNEARTTLEPKVDDSFDVFHYVGLARYGETGKVEFAVQDAFGDAYWVSKDEFSRWIARSGARVAVIQLMTAPKKFESSSVRHTELVSDFGGTVRAVVAARMPVHPRQIYLFNDGFYNCLKSGATIEAAVQAGRRQVESSRRVDDYAGFGWFTVTTGADAGLQLWDASGLGTDSPAAVRLHGESRQAERVVESRDDEFGHVGS